MSKLSKKAKVEQYDEVERERSLYRHITQLLFNRTEPDGIERFTYEDFVYEYRLYGSLRAVGGVVLITERPVGEFNAHVTAQYLDDWLRKVADLPYGIGSTTEVKIAAEKLANVRRQLFDAELAKAKAQF